MTSGQANDPRQVLGRDVYSRIANAPTGFGGVMPMAPSETPPVPMGEPLEQPLVEPGAQFPALDLTALGPHGKRRGEPAGEFPTEPLMDPSLTDRFPGMAQAPSVIQRLLMGGRA